MRILASFLWAVTVSLVGASSNKPLAFCSPRATTNSAALQSSSRFLGQTVRFVPPTQGQRMSNTRSKSSSLSMFMGSEGGILGVGTPEVFTILLVGYFVLGPSDLFKLVKEIGKQVQNFRTLGSDLTKTVETNMESQLQLEEIRKAQRELNDAFSFRRTINTDETSDVFAPEPAAAAAAEAGAVATAVQEASKTKKKIRVRRRKKKAEPAAEPEIPDMDQLAEPVANNVPDLDMAAAFEEATPVEDAVDEAAKLREERLERLSTGTQPSSTTGPSWYDEGSPDTAAGETMVSESDPAESVRFNAQLGSDWNSQIMANEEKLSPLAVIMEKLALLEEEKQSADLLLEEEFRMRAKSDERYYQDKRRILEEAAAEVQAAAYADMSSTNGGAAVAADQPEQQS